MSFKKSLLLVLVTLCTTSLLLYAKQFPTSNKITSYVLYAQDQQGETIALLRTIEESLNKSCPTPLIDNAADKTIVMQVRHNPAPVDFPITVCEALYPKNTQLYLFGKALLKPSYKSDNIAVFGDSGCKSSKQTCTLDSDNWFFNKLANIAAATQPEVVLHMGDYNYSGTPGSIKMSDQKHKVQVYDAGDNTTQGMCKIAGAYYGQNSYGSQFRDRWKYWQQDFFSPAEDLLSSAPWIFARGNHELCSRAGVGWFYLLDSNSSLLGKYKSQLSCPAANNPTPVVFSQPYAVNLDTTNVLVLDSTNACDSGLLNVEQYQNQFLLAKKMLSKLPTGFNILQTHRPMFGIDKLANVGSCGDGLDQEKGQSLCPMSQTLQQANRLSGLTNDVQLLISGHMHRFQSINFENGIFPDQLVVGTSGVKLAKNFPEEPIQLQIEKSTATVNGLSQYSYLKLEIKDTTNNIKNNSSKNAWNATLIAPDSQTILECQAGQQQLCRPPK